jgi:hypothetical protein
LDTYTPRNIGWYQRRSSWYVTSPLANASRAKNGSPMPVRMPGVTDTSRKAPFGGKVRVDVYKKRHSWNEA